METKFKIGDKVKVIEDLKGNHRYDNLFAASEMEQYRGMTGVINKVDTDGHYKLDITNGKFFWSDSMLELVEPKTFTKADLEPGMVVEYRNGERRLFVNGTFMGVASYSFISDFTDDLKFDGIPTVMNADNAFDIVKVYRTQGHKFSTACQGRYLTLIWERKEVKKEPKYKVRDRVRVRSDLTFGKEYDPPVMVVTSMVHNFAGKSCVIREVDTIKKDGVVRYKIEDCDWVWTENMFEGLVEYEEMTVAEIEEKLGFKVKIVDGE